MENLKEFDNHKMYNNFRSGACEYLDIRSNFGNGFIVNDKFNILIDDSKNLFNVDEFDNSKKKYRYNTITEVLRLINKYNNKQFITLGTLKHHIAELKDQKNI